MEVFDGSWSTLDFGLTSARARYCAVPLRFIFGILILFLTALSS